MSEELQSTVTHIKESVDRMADDIRSLKVSHEELNRAFPEGDLEGHRRYHQLIIEEIEWRKRLRQALIEKSLLGLIIGVAAFTGTALVGELKRVFIAFVNLK